MCFCASAAEPANLREDDYAKQDSRVLKYGLHQFLPRLA